MFPLATPPRVAHVCFVHVTMQICCVGGHLAPPLGPADPPYTQETHHFHPQHGVEQAWLLPILPPSPRYVLRVQRGMGTGPGLPIRAGIHSPSHHLPSWLPGLGYGDHMREVQSRMSQQEWLPSSQGLSVWGSWSINSLPLPLRVSDGVPHCQGNRGELRLTMAMG